MQGGKRGGGGSCGAVPERFRCGSSAVRKGGAGRSSVSGEEGAGAGGRGRGTVGGGIGDDAVAPRADGVRRPTSADVSKHVSTISHLNRRHSLLAFSATIISRVDYFLLPPPLLPPLGNPKKKRKRFQRKFTSPSKCVCVSLSLSLSLSLSPWRHRSAN